MWVRVQKKEQGHGLASSRRSETLSRGKGLARGRGLWVIEAGTSGEGWGEKMLCTHCQV